MTVAVERQEGVMSCGMAIGEWTTVDDRPTMGSSDMEPAWDLSRGEEVTACMHGGIRWLAGIPWAALCTRGPDGSNSTD